MLRTTVFVILIQFGFNIYNTLLAFQNVNTEQGGNIDYNDGNFIASIGILVICYGLYLYPVIGLISEIKSGIMSQETYPREAYSCCCDPKRQFN